MKYFNPSYWFKLWLLSAPLFNDKTQGINAKSIDNKKIKDWASNNTTDISLIENQELSLSNNQTIQLQNNDNIQSIKKLEIDHFYENFLKTQVWSRDPQIAQQQLQEIQEEHHQFLKAQHERIKRKDEYKKIAYIHELEIGYNDINYLSNILRIIDGLRNNNIIERIFERDNVGAGGNIVPDTIYQTLINSEYEYFVIPISYEGTGNDVRLVFRTDNLYLEGFIVTYHPGGHLPDINNYYYFDDARLRVFPTISNESYDSINLGFNGHYSTLWTETLQTRSINWIRIVSAFNRIRNYDNSNSNNEQNRSNLALVVLTTSEVLRFRGIFQLILNLYINSDSHTDWSIIQPIVNNWSTYSSIILEILENIDNIRTNANILRALGIAIIAYSFIRNENKRCNQLFIIEDEVCKIISEIKKIQGKIISIKILDKNTQGGNLEAGTIYVGTTNGVYLILNNGNVYKFNGLNFPITSIKLDNSGSAYITNNQEEVYHLNLVGWGSEKIKNIESSNLEEELKIYYSTNKENRQLNFKPYLGHYKNNIINTLHLFKINPVENYKKLQFLGDVFSNNWGVRTKWGSWIYDGQPQNRKPFEDQPPACEQPNDYEGTFDLSYFMKTKDNRNNDFHDIIEKTKEEISSGKENILQKFTNEKGYSCCESLSVNQRFGLTWYSENDNYYLRVWGLQYCEWWCTGSSLECSIKLGNGIRLYNDDTNTRSKREAFDISKFDEPKYNNQTLFDDKLQNTTLWDKNITNLINNEQHLPINNKTNFATNNITSL